MATLPIAVALAGIPALASVLIAAIQSGKSSSNRSNSYPRVAKVPRFSRAKTGRGQSRVKKSAPRSWVQHSTAKYSHSFPRPVSGGRNGSVERLL